MTYGAQGMAGRLLRVLVNRPGERFGAAHETEGAFYAEPIDLGLAQAQHDALVTVLEDAGAQVERLGHEAGPDSIYTYDPALVCDGGAMLLRSGKAIRQAEATAMGEWFERNGIPVLARLEAPELADGGDLLWLDSHTLVIGRGFRTNEAGACAIKKALEPYVDAMHVVDLPIGQGADYCLHTLSVISMLDRDLAVVSLPLMPVHLYELLRARGVELIEIDSCRMGLARAQRPGARSARRRHARRQPEDGREVTSTPVAGYRRSRGRTLRSRAQAALPA